MAYESDDISPALAAGYSSGAQILIGVILYLVSIVGTVGNLSLIIALRKNRKLKNSSNFLTISLAASDILVAGIAMPICGYAALNINGTGTKDATGGAGLYNYSASCVPADDTVRLGPVLCGLNGLLIYTSSKISTWTLCCMAIERYIAVIHPLTYTRWITKRRILSVTAVIWALSILVELPQVLGWFPYVYYHNAFGCLSPSFHHMGYKHPWFIVFSISKKVLLTLLPTPIIAYCYHMIIVVSFKSKHTDNIFRRNFNTPKEPIQPTPERGRRLTAHKSIVAVLTKTTEKYQCYKKSFIWFIIIIAYIICWTPVSSIGILMNFLDTYCEDIFFRGLVITTFVVAIMNSCVNPVIYGFLHQQVRRTFYDIFCCRNTHTRLRLEEQQNYLRGEATLHSNTRITNTQVFPIAEDALSSRSLPNGISSSAEGRSSSPRTILNPASEDTVSYPSDLSMNGRRTRNEVRLSPVVRRTNGGNEGSSRTNEVRSSPLASRANGNEVRSSPVVNRGTNGTVAV